MTKEMLIEVLTKYVPDGQEIAVGGLWFKTDVEDWCEQDLTDEQWASVVHWFEKYQDSSYDLNEAVHYATKEVK